MFVIYAYICILYICLYKYNCVYKVGYRPTRRGKKNWGGRHFSRLYSPSARHSNTQGSFHCPSKKRYGDYQEIFNCISLFTVLSFLPLSFSLLFAFYVSYTFIYLALIYLLNNCIKKVYINLCVITDFWLRPFVHQLCSRTSS